MHVLKEEGDYTVIILPSKTTQLTSGATHLIYWRAPLPPTTHSLILLIRHNRRNEGRRNRNYDPTFENAPTQSPTKGLFGIPEDDILDVLVLCCLCYIWKVLLVMLVIYGKLAKVAIRQRSFLLKLCSGGAGLWVLLLQIHNSSTFSLRPFYVLLLI